MLRRIVRRRTELLVVLFFVSLNVIFWRLTNLEKENFFREQEQEQQRKQHQQQEEQQHDNQQKEFKANISISSTSPSGHIHSLDFQPFVNTYNINYTSYLPATISVIVRYYANTREKDSLSMMLPPRHYQQMTCPQLRYQHQIEYNTVVQRINFTEGPKFSVHGFFYDPYPLCGRYLLSYLTSEQHPYLFALRVKSSGTTVSNDILTVPTGEWNSDVFIEQCGDCLETATGSDDKDPCAVDILFMARLMNDNRVLHAEVLPSNETLKDRRKIARNIRFFVTDPGDYILEVKMVHVNGTSDDVQVPKTLGFVGTRATVNNRKSFLYGGVCDIQRNIYGSPLLVRVVAVKNTERSTITPFCNISTNYNTSEGGQWVRFVDGADPDTPEGAPHSLAANCTLGDRYCYGNPNSLTDACGHNNHLVWVPSTCRLRIFARKSGGPSTGCLRVPPLQGRMSFMLLIGDSVMREYKSNCDALRLGQRGSNLTCVFANIAPEGKYFSQKYAHSVVRAMIDNVENTRPLGVLVTNFGIQHMIGKATTSQWIMFVDAFIDEWCKRNVTVLRGPYTTMSPSGSPKFPRGDEMDGSEWQLYMDKQNRRSLTIINYTEKEVKDRKFPAYMEWAVWLSPPTVHYARHGMTHQRELLWDRLAYERLQKIGFIRIDTVIPTLSRQEGSWDGLHQLSQYGKVQSAWRNRKAATHKFNGGVSFMLFLILTNVICFS
ncbi:putative GPI-anchored surface protein [Trypanosoma theileri]|uniref:Putative GPI-anchored surface protein n=1 Tax=Trypanosoma theileri TaxID=67003 RepID=A0A1X0NLN0_9TRYP|nr:putative GPI-anchored surface protein [Trypanosoma theileri]ORC85030.1 putative GPI-anchored surface protein [Trypanosoma theileri]